MIPCGNSGSTNGTVYAVVVVVHVFFTVAVSLWLISMSFKREGSDQSQLNVLQKRRVADLLSNFIPEDEAALMKNGRYTCLVCSYRPVFDTVDMLTVHRKGKKHLEGLKWFYNKKTQLKLEIEKRKHENYAEAEVSRKEPSSSAPLLAQTRKLTHHALLKTVPYNSCHRKTRTNSESGPLRTGSDPFGDPFGTTQPELDKSFGMTRDKLPSSSSCSFNAANKGSDTTGNEKGSQPEVLQESEPLTPHRRRELEHYLKLKSDGWLKDKSGQWVKDENVEFDSDEDEPPALTAPLQSD
ncbi:sodium channel modifier 1 [Lampris incognitus]|uniref:sodium channel modifier 1 n=1 Tax=Lampris incognitus TaxID=2546036 RepID=UPI0024B59867|nr:sodium channel modifier 1 [Lampris incognitus]